MLYKTTVVIISDSPIPDRYELENVVTGIGNGCCSGDVTIVSSEELKDEQEEE